MVTAKGDLNAYPSWQPLGVREMQPAPTIEISAVHQSTFTLDFLVSHFKVREWSTGFFWDGEESAGEGRGGTFYIIDPAIDPYCPTQAGKHGARLIPFCREQEGPDYDNSPLFVATGEQDGCTSYRYLGHYSQTRFSDWLDHDTTRDRVPRKVLDHWAKWLASADRPKWVSIALRDHFFAQPIYEGNGDQESLTEHVQDLRHWLAQSQEDLNALTKRDIREAFDKAETDDPPGLRLQWEYLQCVDFNERFYHKLVLASSVRAGELSAKASTTGWDITGPSAKDYERAASRTPPIVPRSRLHIKTPKRITPPMISTPDWPLPGEPPQRQRTPTAPRADRVHRAETPHYVPPHLRRG